MDNIKISTYYNTSLRNLGLYTSISIALLGGSRFFIGKDNQNRQRLLLILSLLFLVLSIVYGAMFINDYIKIINNNSLTDKFLHQKWIILPILIMLINSYMLYFIHFSDIYNMYKNNIQ